MRIDPGSNGAGQGSRGARASRAACFAALCLFAGNAAGAECAPFPRARVELQTRIAPTMTYNVRSRGEISALAGNGHGNVNTGLTRTETRFELGLEAAVRPLGPNRWCVGIAKVTADWRLDSVTVDIAREYRPGSCQYRVVRDHEEEHVALNRAAFERHVPRIRARLEAAAVSIGTVETAAEPQRATQALVDRLMKETQPAIDEFKREARRVNAAIDTPESYRATSARCREW